MMAPHPKCPWNRLVLIANLLQRALFAAHGTATDVPLLAFACTCWRGPVWTVSFASLYRSLTSQAENNTKEALAVPLFVQPKGLRVRWRDP